MDHGASNRTAAELRYPGDIKIEFIPKKAAYARVGTPVKWLIKKGLKKRQSTHRISAYLAGEIDPGLQVGKIAGAPAFLGGQRVEGAEETPESRIGSCCSVGLQWR